MDMNSAKRRRMDSQESSIAGSDESPIHVIKSQPLITSQMLREDEECVPDSHASITSSSSLSIDLDYPSQETESDVTPNMVRGSSGSSPSSAEPTASQPLTQSQPRVCGICRQSIVAFDETKWIRCHNKCGIDYHITCVGLNQRVRLILLQTNTIKWMCNSCRASHKKKPLINII